MGKYSLLIVSALIFSMIAYSYAMRNAIFISNIRTVQSYSQNQAHNIAQSALMASIKDINEGGGNIDIPGPGETSETGFQQWNTLHGEYNIRVFNDDVNNILRVQSTGRFEDVAYITTAGLVLSGGGGFPWPALDHAIYSEEDLIIVGKDINGDVYSGGNLSVGGGVNVFGSAHSDQDINLSNGTIHGTAYSGRTFTISGNSKMNNDVYAVSTDAPKTVVFGSSGGTISGNVYTNSTNSGSVDYSQAKWNSKITGNLYVGPGGNPEEIMSPKKINAWDPALVNGNSSALSDLLPTNNVPAPELPEFPEIPQNQTLLSSINLSGVDRQTLDLRSGHAYVPDVVIQSDTNLDIIVGNQDRVLRVNNLNLAQGHLNIISEGEGRLQLYVENNFNIGGSSTMNDNSNIGGNEKSPLSLLVAYAGSNKVQIDGDQHLNANFFIKDADITLTAGGSFNGNIITGGENVEISGGSESNSRVIFAPKALVKMTQGGKLNGSIVAKSFDSNGGIIVNYTTEFQDTLPDLDGEGGGGNSGYSIAFWH